MTDAEKLAKIAEIVNHPDFDRFNLVRDQAAARVRAIVTETDDPGWRNPVTEWPEVEQEVIMAEPAAEAASTTQGSWLPGGGVAPYVGPAETSDVQEETPAVEEPAPKRSRKPRAFS